MVKIREGLPLVDGQTTEADSASLTAKLAHDSHEKHALMSTVLPKQGTANDANNITKNPANKTLATKQPVTEQLVTNKHKTDNQATHNSFAHTNPVNQRQTNLPPSSSSDFHSHSHSHSHQHKHSPYWHQDFSKQLDAEKLSAGLDYSIYDADSFINHQAHTIVTASSTDHSNSSSSTENTNQNTQNTQAVQTDENTIDTQIHESSIDIEAWIAMVAERIGQPKLDKLADAVALIQHMDYDYPNKRSSTFVTGIGMTDILTYIYQDEDALVSAMLYRSARHQLIELEQIEAKFGADISNLVADTLAMGRLSETIEKNKRFEDHLANNQREQLSNIYSMLISVTNDVRVVMIKLAERTFAMRELSFSTKERQKRVAREVMTIYAPLAHRLGIAQIKWELEDLSFRYLAPDRYKEIAKLLAEKRSERETYIKRVTNQLKEALSDAQIEGDVSGRVKHIYSIYRKMKLKSLSFDQLYDIRALRVLVNTQAECYYVLGLVHGLWRHIPEQFDDYITNPKANGYRSLHTAVIAEHKSLEVQIRTHDMHFEAELGMCAHVNYKEGGKADAYLNRRISSLRQLLSMNNDKNNRNLAKPDGNHDSQEPTHTGNDKLGDGTENSPSTASSGQPHTTNHCQQASQSYKANKLEELDEEEQLVDFEEFERIYIFSRDGDIIELPKGATVLDCAYYIHTQVGNQAQAGRVNQRYVPLTYPLKTGEQVEIITKASREPNRDWLVPSLGYITTSRARSKLRQWFNRLDRDKNIEIGRQMLVNELERLSVHPNSIDLGDFTQHFNANHPDDILVGLVTGDIGVHQLTNQISRLLNLEPEQEENYQPSVHPKSTGKLGAYDIYVDGLDNIEISLAKCCSPVQGEPIAGYITQSKGVSIHNRDCMEYNRLIDREPNRQIDAVWRSHVGRRQPVAIYIESHDRRGLLRDLTQVIDNEDINIRRVETLSTDDDIAQMAFHIEVSGLSQLSKLLAKLEQQHGVIQARRSVG